MMKKDKTVRIALSSALLLTVAAAGVTMYRQESNGKQSKENQAEEQQLADGEETPLSELSQGQKEAMESGGSQEQEETPETADVTTSEAQAENTQELNVTVLPEEEKTEEEAEQSDETSAQTVLPESILNFTEDSQMLWPVNGEVLIDYSMDATTYFPTLEQYRYHPALVLGAPVDSPVQAASNGKVIAVTEDVKTGTSLTMDMGNGYQAVYGQLKDLAVEEGQIVEAGTVLGYVNEPSKYYVTEGANLYFAMTKDGEAIDPMLYIETVTE